MATLESTFKTEQDERSIKRDANANQRLLSKPLRYADITYTMVGTEADDDVLELLVAQEEFVIIPELCRLVDADAAVDTDVNLLLRVKDGDTGALTSVSGTTTFDNDSVAMAAAATMLVGCLGQGTASPDKVACCPAAGKSGKACDKACCQEAAGKNAKCTKCQAK